MSTETLNGALYLSLIKQGAARIYKERKDVNDLNVFPIPDGDTGDNMYMTINSGASVAEQSDNLGEVAAQISKGMLLGARGNSGVILSRIFAGIGKRLNNVAAADIQTFREALKSGVEESYKAVSVPVEGTILTVFKDGAASAEGNDFEQFLDCMIDVMEESLDRTPQLLPVLAEAGVVDSGGAGLISIFKGFRDALSGQTDDVSQTMTQQKAPSVNLDSFTSESELEFGYCTEFLLRLQTSKVNLDTFDEKVIIDYLTSVGESVVCFRDGTIVKAHVHTRTPGDILNHCQQYGEYLTIKIENMTLQHHESHFHDEKAKPRKPVAVVAVASGEGLVRTFKEAGADEVIEGGQTMNPSARSFIEAFDKVNARTVFVFPNNSNIILTARQAAQIYQKSKVVVIPSTDIGSGYVALASMDKSEKNLDAVVEAAARAMESTCTGMVSKAVRDTQKDGVDVVCGDYIGFHDGKIVADSSSASECLKAVASDLGVADHDVALLFSGADISSEDAQALTAELSSNYPRTEFILTAGGQPVYDYIIALC